MYDPETHIYGCRIDIDVVSRPQVTDMKIEQYSRPYMYEVARLCVFTSSVRMPVDSVRLVAWGCLGQGSCHGLGRAHNQPGQL